MGRANRVRLLPDRGTLLVSTDLHGNLEDFERLCAIFLAAHAIAPDTHWVLLGDLVHGPDDAARQREPELYGYPDDSPALVERVSALCSRYPDRVHYVLGNHDHGHVGGPATSKFHDNEVEFLESRLSESQKDALRSLFGEALLAVLAPCGAFLSHGSPDERLDSLDQLRALDFIDGATPEQRRALHSLLWSYGQSGATTARVLEALTQQVGFPLTMVIHGHDRDPTGWYIEGANQAQPVIFGAPRENKRYLRLDLAARYTGPLALREGHEVLRLHEPR